MQSSSLLRRGLQVRRFSSAKRESTFVRVWVRPKEAWPIFAVLGGALLLMTYKIMHDANAPGVDFDKSNRKTIDYLQNSKDPKKAEEWGNTAIRTGPEFIKERLIDKEALSGPKKEKPA